MQPEAGRLTLEEISTRYTLLQLPPTRLTLFTWREAIGMSLEEAGEAQELAGYYLKAIQSFITAPKRDQYRPVTAPLVKARKEPETVTEEVLEKCRGWMEAHARQVEEDLLPAQGFSLVNGPEAEVGAARVWQRGEERLFTILSPGLWHYLVSPMNDEEWGEYRQTAEEEDRFHLLLRLAAILNDLGRRYTLRNDLTLEGPDADLLISQDDVDPGEDGYTRLSDLLDWLWGEKVRHWESPPAEELLDTLGDLDWEDLAHTVQGLERERSR